jgi:transcriptional regulator with XRE-family HTH domain
MIGLGRILAETREARGIALEEVERETRIARRYLLALEEEDFTAFPAQVQARGFLRVYSQYLGLDAAEMLALFPNETEVDESDGLIHSDRIFREQRPERRPVLPSISLPRQPALIAAGTAAVLFVAGLLGSVCASGAERARAEQLLLAEHGSERGYKVPSVEREELTGALQRMEAAGIRPLVIEVASSEVPAGQVIDQSPPPNTAVRNPTDAVIFVSRGRR